MQTLFFLWNKHSGVVKTKDVPSKQSRPLVPHIYCLFLSHSKQPPSSGVHTWTLPNVWCTLDKAGGASPFSGSFECNWQVRNVGLELSSGRDWWCLQRVKISRILIILRSPIIDTQPLSSNLWPSDTLRMVGGLPVNPCGCPGIPSYRSTISA